MLGYWSEPSLNLVCRSLGLLITRRQVIDPSAWCGAVTTILYGDEETPSLMEKLWGDGVKVIGRERGSRKPCLFLAIISFGLHGSLSGTSKRGSVSGNIFLIELQHELEMLFFYRYHGIKSPFSLTHSFTFLNFKLATYVPLLSYSSSY